MDWIFVVLDTIFSGLFKENGWFAKMGQNFTGSVEELVYRVETGQIDVASLSRTFSRLVCWLPIVFGVCLILDIFIRSRFVRYSYRDENQAKKSVWWRWQSDVDAATALEAGVQQSLLAQRAGADGAFGLREDEVLAVQLDADDANAEEASAAEPLQAQDENAVVFDEAQQEDDDTLDRGPIVSAKQNRVRRDSTIAQRLQGAATDLKDQLTITRSALLFAPKAIARNAQITRENLAESSRRSIENMRRKSRSPRSANARDEAAEAEAFFAQGAQTDYVDGEYGQEQPVETGGIEGYSFKDAAEALRSVQQTGEDVQKQSAAAKKKPHVKKRVRLTYVGRKKLAAQKAAQDEAAVEEEKEAQTQEAKTTESENA